MASISERNKAALRKSMPKQESLGETGGCHEHPSNVELVGCHEVTACGGVHHQISDALEQCMFLEQGNQAIPMETDAGALRLAWTAGNCHHALHRCILMCCLLFACHCGIWKLKLQGLVSY